MALWTVPPAPDDVAPAPRTDPWDAGPRLLAAPPPVTQPVLGVSGARGGTGASTLAAACARALSRDRGACVLVDLDEDGGGIDVLCGIEDQPGLRWADLRDATGEVPASELRALLPRWGDVDVLSHDRARPGEVAPAALHDVLTALGGSVPLVLDLPRHIRSRAPVPVDLHALVVPRDLHGVAAAQRSLHDLDAAVPVGLVTCGAAPGGLTEGIVADAVGADVLARLHVDRALPRAVERGVGPFGTRLHRTALAVLAALDRAHTTRMAGPAR